MCYYQLIAIVCDYSSEVRLEFSLCRIPSIEWNSEPAKISENRVCNCKRRHFNLSTADFAIAATATFAISRVVSRAQWRINPFVSLCAPLCAFVSRCCSDNGESVADGPYQRNKAFARNRNQIATVRVQSPFGDPVATNALEFNSVSTLFSHSL